MAVSVAVGNRLITRHLLSGRIAIDWPDVELVDAGPAPAPIFPAMVTTRPYDVGELTIGNFIVAKDNGVRLVALPIFPNLFFPLTGVTVNDAAGIAEIGDLTGKRVGVPLGFASNPAVWLRGILAHHHGVAADTITWVEGQNDSLRRRALPQAGALRTGADGRTSTSDSRRAISTRSSSRAATLPRPRTCGCSSTTPTRSWRATTPLPAYSPSTRFS